MRQQTAAALERTVATAAATIQWGVTTVLGACSALLWPTSLDDLGPFVVRRPQLASQPLASLDFHGGQFA